MFFPTVSIPGEGSTFAKTSTTIAESFYTIISNMVERKLLTDHSNTKQLYQTTKCKT